MTRPLVLVALLGLPWYPWDCGSASVQSHQLGQPIATPHAEPTRIYSVPCGPNCVSVVHVEALSGDPAGYATPPETPRSAYQQPDSVTPLDCMGRATPTESTDG